jgi:hypothetical protein
MTNYRLTDKIVYDKKPCNYWITTGMDEYAKLKYDFFTNENFNFVK